MKTLYDDIIRLPHHISQNHPQMPLRDRAAQFAPFSALTGYEAAVGETARLKDRPEVTIEYFVPDERKSGGAYVTVTGRVRHISVPERTLVMEDGTVIPLDDIVSLTGGELNLLE